MSVRVTDMKLDPVKKEATVSLFADARGDVSPSMTVDGLPDGYTVAQGSSVLTASAEIAFMKSDGTWSWV